MYIEGIFKCVWTSKAKAILLIVTGSERITLLKLIMWIQLQLVSLFEVRFFQASRRGCLTDICLSLEKMNSSWCSGPKGKQSWQQWLSPCSWHYKSKLLALAWPYTALRFLKAKWQAHFAFLFMVKPQISTMANVEVSAPSLFLRQSKLFLEAILN